MDSILSPPQVVNTKLPCYKGPYLTSASCHNVIGAHQDVWVGHFNKAPVTKISEAEHCPV